MDFYTITLILTIIFLLFISAFFSGSETALTAASRSRMHQLEKEKNVKAKINIHCGKLPKYAGIMPIFWQINDGLDEISITFQDLAENIDTGKVFFEKKIKPSYSLFETTRLAKRQSAHLLNEFLPNVGSNIKNVPNGQLSSDNIALRKFPTNKEIKDFKKIHRLV